MLCSDYLPDLLRQTSISLQNSEPSCDPVSLEELKAMDLPSFEPAFLVLCRVLLNVIHECLKLRLEQRPAGEPSLLSIKQVSMELVENHLFIILLFTILEDMNIMTSNSPDFPEPFPSSLLFALHRSHTF